MSKKMQENAKEMVLIMKTRGHYRFITKAQELAFLEESTGNALGMRIEGQYVSFSSVAEIITAEEFYRLNPEKRPSPVSALPLFSRNDVLNDKRTESGRHVTLVLEGIESFMRENPWHGNGVRPAQKVYDSIRKEYSPL